MQAARRITGSFISSLRRFSGNGRRLERPFGPREVPRIGLALGGGFARGIAHAGVLAVFEENHIPIHCIAGVSAGAIVAAAYAARGRARRDRRGGLSDALWRCRPLDTLPHGLPVQRAHE